MTLCFGMYDSLTSGSRSISSKLHTTLWQMPLTFVYTVNKFPAATAAAFIPTPNSLSSSSSSCPGRMCAKLNGFLYPVSLMFTKPFSQSSLNVMLSIIPEDGDTVTWTSMCFAIFPALSMYSFTIMNNV